MSTAGGYISYPIEASPDDLLAEAYDFIKTKATEWQENDGNLDTWILQVGASQAADLLSLCQDVPDTIFQWFGSKLIAVPPLDATPAIVGSTWVFQDNAGYTVPAGTQVSISDDVGVNHAFETTADFSVQAGSTSTPAGGVTLSSVEMGAALSNLGANGLAVPLIDTLAYVSTVTLTGATAGGQDAELSSEYNERLARKLQRLSQRPVLASDFSLAALDVTGVYRALALDGYNSANQTYNNERYIGIAAVDENGVPISAGIKTQLQSYLDGLRETNFVVNVFDPTVTQVDVTCNVKCLIGYTTAAVQANVLDAIRAYLNPANWGKDPSVTDAVAQAQTWVPINTVYWSKMISVVSAATGVDRVISLTMALHSGTLGTADLTLPGAAPLADDGTINATATP